MTQLLITILNAKGFFPLSRNNNNKKKKNSGSSDVNLALIHLPLIAKSISPHSRDNRLKLSWSKKLINSKLLRKNEKKNNN